MSIWQKLKSIATTPIPGFTRAGFLTAVLLGTTTALCIVLPTHLQRRSILVENTSGKNESLELKLILQSGEELHLKATGEITGGLALSLRRMLGDMGLDNSPDKYFPFTPL